MGWIPGKRGPPFLRPDTRSMLGPLMNDGVDIWQRYDTKVVQVRLLEEQVRRLQGQVADLEEERGAVTRKLSTARRLAERLRQERSHEAPGADPAQARIRDDYDRAREVIGCLVSSLAGSWNARQQAWRADSKSGGRLLYALTRGAMASVSMDSFRVDTDWLRKLELDQLRIELGFDDGGVELSIEDDYDDGGDLGEFVRDEPYVDPYEEPYGDDQGLPPPPRYTEGEVGATRHDPPLISAFDPYDDPEPMGEETRVAAAPTKPLPIRDETRKNRTENTARRSIPAPSFNIGKLVKPT